jgi:hypothetical protein
MRIMINWKKILDLRRLQMIHHFFAVEIVQLIFDDHLVLNLTCYHD